MFNGFHQREVVAVVYLEAAMLPRPRRRPFAQRQVDQVVSSTLAIQPAPATVEDRRGGRGRRPNASRSVDARVDEQIRATALVNLGLRWRSASA